MSLHDVEAITEFSTRLHDRAYDVATQIYRLDPEQDELFSKESQRLEEMRSKIQKDINFLYALEVSIKKLKNGDPNYRAGLDDPLIAIK